MKDPLKTVTDYIREMYEWENQAASDLRFGAMDISCPMNTDRSILESKLASFESDDASISNEFYRIVALYLTSRHRTRHMDGYGFPPRHDPEFEEIIGDPIVLEEEAFINTKMNALSDSRAERFYKLLKQNGAWRIDQITEKNAGEYYDLIA